MRRSWLILLALLLVGCDGGLMGPGEDVETKLSVSEVSGDPITAVYLLDLTPVPPDAMLPDETQVEIHMANRVEKTTWGEIKNKWRNG